MGGTHYPVVSCTSLIQPPPEPYSLTPIKTRQSLSTPSLDSKQAAITTMKNFSMYPNKVPFIAATLQQSVLNIDGKSDSCGGATISAQIPKVGAENTRKSNEKLWKNG